MFLIVLLLFSIVASFIGCVDFIDCVKFILTQVFIYILPGTLLCSFSNSRINIIKTFIMSYLYGYVISIALYIILLIFDIQEYIIIPSIFLLIMALYRLYQFRDKYFYYNKNDDIFISIFLFLAYIVGIIVFQCNNLHPLISDVFSANQDLVFWMRNTVASTFQYPLPDLSIIDKTFHYHYFSSLALANLHYVTGIDIFNLSFSFSYLINLTLLVFATFLLADKLFRKLLYKKLFMACVLFVSNFESITYITYIHHLYNVSFGLVEGISISLFFIFLILTLFEKSNCKILSKTFFNSILVISVATGLKGPTAMVALGGVGILCFIRLFNKDTRYKSLIYGATYLITFIIVCELFVFDDKMSSGITFSLTDTLFRSGYFKSLYNNILTYINIPIASYVISIITYLISSIAVPVLFILPVINKLRRINSNVTILLISIWIIGVLFTLYTSQSGMSQMYFMFISYITLLLFVVIQLEKNNYLSLFRNKLYIIVVIGFSFMLTIYEFRHYVYKSYNFVRGKEMNTHNAKTLNMNEFLALDWIKNNTLKHSILVSNRVLGEGGSRSFIVSAFSERQVLLEGYEYSVVDTSVLSSLYEKVSLLFSGDRNVIDDLTAIGVDYIVEFKDMPGCISSDNKFSLVFCNDNVYIYKIR